MSRVTYDDYEGADWALRAGRWEARVKAVLNGKPGQVQFRALEAALLALPRKRLIYGNLSDGEDVCALGAMLTHRGMPIDELELVSSDDDDGRLLATAVPDNLRKYLGLTSTLAWLITEANDEKPYHGITPEQRYSAMLAWARSNIRA